MFRMCAGGEAFCRGLSKHVSRHPMSQMKVGCMFGVIHRTALTSLNLVFFSIGNVGVGGHCASVSCRGKKRKSFVKGEREDVARESTEHSFDAAPQNRVAGSEREGVAKTVTLQNHMLRPNMLFSKLRLRMCWKAVCGKRLTFCRKSDVVQNSKCGCGAGSV